MDRRARWEEEMKGSASKFNNLKVRVAYGLAGLTLWAWFVELSEKALAPYRGIFCMAGKELLLAIPFGRIYEVVMASSGRGGAALTSVPLLTWMASVVHLIGCLWKA